VKDGLWKYYWLDSSQYYPVKWFNYSNGNLNGPFQDIQGDSVIVGTYKANQYHGNVKIYHPWSLWLVGIPPKDLTDTELLCSGAYDNGRKNGHWKMYSYTQTLVTEGNYLNDVQQGDWRYYLDKLEGLKSEYAGTLFLTEHYLNGKKNGTSERLVYLEQVSCPCDVNSSSSNTMDSCFKFEYYKIKETSTYKDDSLHGLFVRRDSNLNIIRKGEYNMGKKWGHWTVLQPVDGVNQGVVRYEVNYEDDQLSGWFQKYDASNDQLLIEGKYLKDEKTGIWKTYFPDAQKRISQLSDFASGKFNYAKEYNYGGKLYLFSKYKDGAMISLEQYDTTNLTLQARFEHIQFKEGIYDFDYSIVKDSIRKMHTILETGTMQQEQDPLLFVSIFELFATEQLEKIYLDGPYYGYLKNGKLYNTGNFRKNKRDGLWKQYFYDQNVIVQVQFDAGKRGDERFYSLSKESPFSGKFTNNLPDGGFEQIKIKDGLRNGNTVLFGKDGKKSKKVKYVDGVEKM
jgi:antitoxin component YwqK of YwqJK toxin-antitoxin module